MSIILKGIDMPKASNDDMIVIIRHDGNAEVWQSGKKETKAQAIQIPTPHGRLIEELEKKLYEYIDPFEVPGALEACYDTMEAFYDAMDRFTKGE